jgi:hypothetical protein
VLVGTCSGWALYDGGTKPQARESWSCSGKVASWMNLINMKKSDNIKRKFYTFCIIGTRAVEKNIVGSISGHP